MLTEHPGTINTSSAPSRRPRTWLTTSTCWTTYSYTYGNATDEIIGDNDLEDADDREEECSNIHSFLKRITFSPRTTSRDRRTCQHQPEAQQKLNEKSVGELQ